MRSKINIVWLKRDLRLQDHEPLYRAQEENIPFILLYIYEPSLISDPHYDKRHWRFIQESLEDIQLELAKNQNKLSIAYGESVEIFNELSNCYDIQYVFSHEETGLNVTYERDKNVANFFRRQNITWMESQSNAVIRGLQDRKTWDKAWARFMRDKTIKINPQKLNIIDIDFGEVNIPSFEVDSNFQKGGMVEAQATLEDFFSTRGQDYYKFISKPHKSRSSCSRMSVYIAYGNISIRQIYQKILENWNRVGWRRSMAALSSRIHWHCHFIQKFESECRIENETINKGYQNFPYLVEDEEHADFTSWLNGTTGFPLIDASMRSLRYSGYINFRSRAMVVSFACHYLRIHWKLVAKALARLFLDFEPGIHFPQIQMQAGVTGINTIRIYNPKKQAMDHDPEATFIKTWIPELNSHQPEYIINLPLHSNDLFSNESNYPQAQYNFQERIKESKDLLWQWKKSIYVKQNNAIILAKHVRPQ